MEGEREGWMDEWMDGWMAEREGRTSTKPLGWEASKPLFWDKLKYIGPSFEHKAPACMSGSGKAVRAQVMLVLRPITTTLCPLSTLAASLARVRLAAVESVLYSVQTCNDWHTFEHLKNIHWYLKKYMLQTPLFSKMWKVTYVWCSIVWRVLVFHLHRVRWYLRLKAEVHSSRPAWITFAPRRGDPLPGKERGG